MTKKQMSLMTKIRQRCWELTHVGSLKLYVSFAVSYISLMTEKRDDILVSFIGLICKRDL